MIKITIPLPPITKKNHQQIYRNKKTGKPFVTQSKAYKEYQKSAGYFIPCKYMMIAKPVNVKAIYYMPTRRKVDLCNLHAALHDILVHYGVLEDDNSKIIVSTDGSRVGYDKENPRTEIIITEV